MKPVRYQPAMIEEFVTAGYWTAETFYDFYERNAARYGEREALADSRYRVTWAEAKTLVDAIASAWVEIGLPRDARVIIQAPNSVYGFLSRIACERAGLIALTVYPYLRQHELEYMLEQTQARMVIIPRIYRGFDYLAMYLELAKGFPSLEHIYLFDEEVPAGVALDPHSLVKTAREYRNRINAKALRERRFDPLGDVALLTTTSGTTGLPKLVEWPIAPRLCTSKARVDIWRLTAEDVAMAVAPHAGGAAGTLTYFAAPLVGAKTVMLEEFEADAALRTMAREKVTAIGVVPTHLMRMLEKRVEDYDLSALRFIRSAGGYLSPQLAQEAEARLQAVITSDLGTQDKGSVSGCTVSDPAEMRRRTVGRMLPGNQVRLLDTHGKEVAAGEPGLLWFRGPHAPAGYYRDEAAAAEVFDPDGWCTTGDVVALQDEFLLILGRQKDVVIRGGQNIYPAEIEGLLNEHPAVAAAAIIGVPDPEYGERCCAFIVPRADRTFTFADMTSFLEAKRIAKFKFPERLELLTSMPTLGDSGKIDKQALRQSVDAGAKAA